MSKRNTFHSRLAGLCIAAVLSLTGCIENSGSTQLADGIGGTGITFFGRLTGFGSVHVNGVHFNTDNARFTRDGVSTSAQSDFNIGEIIQVVGTVNADRKTGTATEVIYSDVIEGPVTRVADGRTLSVMEQTVITDQLTVFHNFRKLADLQTDNIVEVSGYTDADGNIQATSLKLISEAFTAGDTLEVEGAVSQLNTTTQTFNVNGLTVHYAQALFTGMTQNDLRNGLYLAATATQNIENGTMIASELTKLDDAPEQGVIYEIEGLVSYFLSPGYFEIDGFPIATNADTTFEGGSAADLDENSFMLVVGTANAQGIIVAESIKLSDNNAGVYLEAPLEAIDPDAGTLTVLGQTVSIDAHTLLSDDTTDEFVVLELSQFNIGSPVYIVAYPDADDPDHYIASRLSRVNASEGIYLSGQAQDPDVIQGQFTLFNNTITSNDDTLYLGIDTSELSRAEFFEQVNDSGVYVDIIGTRIGNDYILAEILTLGTD